MYACKQQLLPGEWAPQILLSQQAQLHCSQTAGQTREGCTATLQGTKGLHLGDGHQHRQLQAGVDAISQVIGVSQVLLSQQTQRLHHCRLDWAPWQHLQQRKRRVTGIVQLNTGLALHACC